MISRLSQPDAADLLLVDDGPNLGALREEAAAFRARLGELADLFADGAIAGAQLARDTDRARAALQAVEEQLADAERVSALGDLVTAGDVQSVWDGLDLERRRAVIDALMAITLHPPGKGVRTFRPETVRVAWRWPRTHPGCTTACGGR